MLHIIYIYITFSPPFIFHSEFLEYLVKSPVCLYLQSKYINCY